MDNILLTQVPLDQLLNAITEKVMIAIRQEKNEDQQEKLLNTKEVCELFKVTPVTINAWIKKDVLKVYPKGGRNFFKYLEVMGSLTTLKKYKVK